MFDPKALAVSPSVLPVYCCYCAINCDLTSGARHSDCAVWTVPLINTQLKDQAGLAIGVNETAASSKHLSTSKSLHEQLEVWARKHHAAPKLIHPAAFAAKDP